jgi:hypothetical protein
MGVVAFKEWAVVCRALAQGQQSIILRKGGIAEAGGRFRPEHDEFLLYPTYFHEHRAGVKPEFLPLLEAAQAEQPPVGILRLTHCVRVVAVRHLSELDDALALDALHVWTPEVVRQRFHYRTPGLFALLVRVFQLPSAVEWPERPAYAGCKSWVELDAPVATAGALPVLAEDQHAELLRRWTRWNR